MTEHITKKMRAKRERRERAHARVRNRVRGSAERPRLSVYKSLRYIYAQVIDDDRGTTLAQASSADPEIREQVGSSTSGKAAAKLVGEVVAARAKEKGIEKVVFDRGGYVYHGRVQAIADAAREKGLQF
ncbi:MAG TPA: 50S ribosomal protein L18 [Thermoanaerobaculia bacterium]|jgi:large subunit ribosomal protein L18|nr:50S ribosomal protein L18 [Thermoanaerobaculia bacterium]